MKLCFRITGVVFTIATLFLCSTTHVEASAKWRLFGKPDKPIETLTLVFVEPQGLGNSDNQRGFDLSAMGVPTCSNWIGQRAASFIATSGTATVFGGSYTRHQLPTALTGIQKNSYRLIFMPVSVVWGGGGWLNPPYGRIVYRVRLFSPIDTEQAVFESTAEFGNSEDTRYNDIFIKSLATDLSDAGLIPKTKLMSIDRVATPTESCPLVVK